ncbi:MAG: hypothetical protein ABIT83_21465 [Massilia sp.]
MDPRIIHIEKVLGFMFEHGCARKFEELGSPDAAIKFWHRNAIVYEKVTAMRPIADSQRIRLVTLIEAIRFEAMHPRPFGEPAEFNPDPYEFSEDLLQYKVHVISMVVDQESVSYSSIDPTPPQTGSLH